MEHLKPPSELQFEGNIAENYKHWLKRFKLYSLASGLSEKSEEIQCAAFLHLCGEDAIKIFETLDISADEKDKIDPLISKFQEYCEPRKNLILIRHRFFSRDQEPSETIDSYVTDLKFRAKDCEFGLLNDSLIRDRIVCGIENDNLRGRLLRNDKLTLESCIDDCRAHEQSNRTLQSFKEQSNPSKVDAVKLSVAKSSSVPCRNCGHSVHRLKTCPARNVTCYKCSRQGHFSRCCRSESSSRGSKPHVESSSSGRKPSSHAKDKSSRGSRRFKRSANAHEVECDTGSSSSCDDDEHLFVGLVGACVSSVNTKRHCKGSSFMANVDICNKPVLCKLDTGADVNMISYSTLTKIMSDPKLSEPKIHVKAYGGGKFQTMGQIKVDCSYKGKQFVQTFQVIDRPAPTLLCASACVEMNMVKRVDTLMMANPVSKRSSSESRQCSDKCSSCKTRQCSDTHSLSKSRHCSDTCSGDSQPVSETCSSSKLVQDSSELLVSSDSQSFQPRKRRKCHVKCKSEFETSSSSHQVHVSRKKPRTYRRKYSNGFYKDRKCCSLDTENKSMASSSKLPANILSEYSDLFEGLGCLKDYECHIDVKEGATPVVHPPRKCPVKFRDKLKDKLDSMVKSGVLEPVNEPTEWVNSMVMVTKRDGKSIRVCLDPKDLNKVIKRAHYPMKTFEEVFSKLPPGPKVMSVLDASNGFWILRLDESSSNLCVMNTPFGRFRFKRLPFGLNLAPEIFQKAMVDALDGLEGVEVVVDDMLVWGSSQEEHDQRLIKVLDRCREKGIKLNKDKCQYNKNECSYLGHVLCPQGVKPDPNKVRAICKMPPPTDVQGVHRFLGSVNYLAKFIPNLSQVCAPIRLLIDKTVEWHWGVEQQNAYDRLKKLLSEAPVLKYFDVDKPVTISVDASSKGVGGYLHQNEGPVAYTSRALTKTQQNYAQIEKEMYAIVVACEKWHDYLYGQEMIYVETDHKPLESIFKKPLHQAPQRLQRMLLRVQKYSLNVKYRPGKELIIADMLSRAYLPDSVEDDGIDDFDVNMIQMIPVSPSEYTRIQTETKSDPELQELMSMVMSGWPDVKSSVPIQATPYWNFRDEITCYDGILYKSQRIIVPCSMRSDMLKLVHKSHLGMEKCKKRARDVLFWPNMNSHIEELVSKCTTCQKYRSSNCKEPLKSHEIPNRPWAKIGTDLLEFRNRDYLLCVDYYSKYPELQLLRDKTSVCVVQSMKSIFARHGISETVISDNGPCFDCHTFKKFAKDWGFQHHTISPHYSQSNGQIENCVKTIKNLLKKAEDTNSDPLVSLLEYRNTPIDGVDLSPAQMLFGRRLRSFIPTHRSLLQPQAQPSSVVHEKLIRRQEKQKFYYDRSAHDLKPLSDGKPVRFRLNDKWVPGIVDSQHSDRSYVLKSSDTDRVYRRNRKHIIPIPVATSDYSATEQTTNYDTPVAKEPVNDPISSDIVPGSSSTQPTQPILRRSTRIRKPPERLDL